MKIKNLGMVIPILFLSISALGQFECPNQDQTFEYIKPQLEIISSDCSPSYDKCNGKIVWENGAFYEGNFSKGKLEGEGLMDFPKKFKYKGEFKNEVPHGTGKIIFENESQYDGEWLNGKMHGKGAFIFPCGYEYIGEFKNGKMEGQGIMRISENETFWGNWVNGKAHGQGTYKRADQSEFQVSYINGEKNGLGSIIYESGDTLVGNWKDGKIDGESIFQFDDGSKITHFWKNGALEEKVVFTQKSGLKLSGNPDMLAKMVFTTSIGNDEEIEKNFSLAWYSIGMEFKSMQNYELANKHLKYAQLFIDPFEDSGFAERLDSELELLIIEREKVEVARKDDSNK